MEADGYGFGQLFSFRYPPYSVVVAAQDAKQAREAFNLFMKDRPNEDGTWIGVTEQYRPKITKSIGDRLLIIAERKR